jgi:tripartite-type tricarboxylate transporter receptor subunit TctC
MCSRRIGRLRANLPDKARAPRRPYPPGGGTDIIGRVVAQKLTDAFNQQVIVDNRGGAAGIVGTEIVAKAAPDGYTLLMAPSSHVINPSVYTKLPYDTARDFAPITLAASAAIVLASHPSLPGNDAGETELDHRR